VNVPFKYCSEGRVKLSLKSILNQYITASCQDNLEVKRNARLSGGLVPLDSVNGNLSANGSGRGAE